jgi:hypothetical protein
MDPKTLTRIAVATMTSMVTAQAGVVVYFNHKKKQFDDTCNELETQLADHRAQMQVWNESIGAFTKA